VLEFGILIFQVTSTWGKKWKVEGGTNLPATAKPHISWGCAGNALQTFGPDSGQKIVH